MEMYVAGFLPEALLIDLPEIDAQHDEIFHRIETLKTVCFESNYVPIDELRALLDLFSRHFVTEEGMAEDAGLDFVEHTRVHSDTLRLLRRALAEVHGGGQDAHSFLRYAEYWFERHISDDDRVFAATLQSGTGNRCHNLRSPGISSERSSSYFSAQA